MKLKIIALMLVLLTLCPMVLSGCGGTSAENPDEISNSNQATVRDPKSLTMWVVCENKISDEDQKAVEDAFNVITKSSFTTYVDLIFYTEDEYEQALKDKFEEIDKRLAEGASPMPESTSTGDEYFINEYGVSELKYPDIYENNVDIVYIAGKEQLTSLVNTGRLYKLNDSLSDAGAAKILNDVIPQAFFTHTKINNGIYAVPNNRSVGTYKYLLVNKELVTGDANGDGTVSFDEVRGTYINFSSIEDFLDCGDIIEYVKASKTDMVPILSDFENPYVKYWSDDGSFSILASRVDPSLSHENVSYENKLKLTNVFGMSYFVDFELMMKKYETGNYFADDAEATLAAQNFGVAVIEGDSTVADTYGENYYIKVISNPELDASNVYSSFYGITTYASDYARALEIIVMLNTNSELRNTLQYGVEGIHYEINEEGRVERYNNNYMMDINTTGNVFIAYLEEYMADNEWELGLATNLDLQVDPMIGFWQEESKISDTIYENLKQASLTFKEGMDACQSVEELQTYFEEARKSVNRTNAYLIASSASENTSIFSVYSKWFDALWPVTNE